MQPRPDLIPAKQHYPEEPRLKEERGKHFIGQQGAGNTARELGKPTPVSAKLISHHQAGDHAHPKVDGEDLRPEMVQRAPDGIFCFQPQPFQHGEIARQANGYRRKNNMKGYGKGELYSRKMKRIWTKHALPQC